MGQTESGSLVRGLSRRRGKRGKRRNASRREVRSEAFDFLARYSYSAESCRKKFLKILQPFT